MEKNNFQNSNDDLKENDYKNSEKNIFPRLLGGTKNEFPLMFPNIKYSSVNYTQLYLQSIVNWKNINIKNEQILSLLNDKAKPKMYSVFKKILCFTESTVNDLQNQICVGANRYKLFLTNKTDDCSYIVKIFIPIYSPDRKKYLIIKTLWLINQTEIPNFITAYYDPNYKENAKNEI